MHLRYLVGFTGARVLKAHSVLIVTVPLPVVDVHPCNTLQQIFSKPTKVERDARAIKHLDCSFPGLRGEHYSTKWWNTWQASLEVDRPVEECEPLPLNATHSTWQLFSANTNEVFSPVQNGQIQMTFNNPTSVVLCGGIPKWKMPDSVDQTFQLPNPCSDAACFRFYKNCVQWKLTIAQDQPESAVSHTGVVVLKAWWQTADLYSDHLKNKHKY